VAFDPPDVANITTLYEDTCSHKISVSGVGGDHWTPTTDVEKADVAEMEIGHTTLRPKKLSFYN
jgi:hypothetical protein